MNYSNLSSQLEEAFPPNPLSRNRITLFIIMIIGFFMYMFAIFKLYQQKRKSLKPLHIYQLNILIGITVSFMIALNTISLMMLDAMKDICYVYFFRLVIRIIINLDIILLQLDRVLAFWKPLFHRTSVTLSTAISEACITKLVAIIAATIPFCIYPEFLICSKCFECNLTRPIFIFMTSYLCICTAIITVIVSLYALTVSIKLNKVQPQLNIQYLQ